MHKFFSLLLICCLFLAAFISCAQSAPVKPASFKTSNLLVIPAKVSPGDDVVISVSVANTGDEAGEYNVELLVNGAVESSQAVSVEGGSSQKVVFDVSREAEGEYTVSIDSLNDKFTVAEAGETASGAVAEPQTYTVTWTDDEFDNFARMLIGKPPIEYKMHFVPGNKLNIEAQMGFVNLKFVFDVDICDGKLCFRNVDKQAWDNVFRKGEPYLIYDGEGIKNLRQTKANQKNHGRKP